MLNARKIPQHLHGAATQERGRDVVITACGKNYSHFKFIKAVAHPVQCLCTGVLFTRTLNRIHGRGRYGLCLFILRLIDW